MVSPLAGTTSGFVPSGATHIIPSVVSIWSLHSGCSQEIAFSLHDIARGSTILRTRCQDGLLAAFCGIYGARKGEILSNHELPQQELLEGLSNAKNIGISGLISLFPHAFTFQTLV